MCSSVCGNIHLNCMVCGCNEFFLCETLWCLGLNCTVSESFSRKSCFSSVYEFLPQMILHYPLSINLYVKICIYNICTYYVQVQVHTQSLRKCFLDVTIFMMWGALLCKLVVGWNNPALCVCVCMLMRLVLLSIIVDYIYMYMHIHYLVDIHIIYILLNIIADVFHNPLILRIFVADYYEYLKCYFTSSM